MWSKVKIQENGTQHAFMLFFASCPWKSLEGPVALDRTLESKIIWGLQPDFSQVVLMRTFVTCVFVGVERSLDLQDRSCAEDLSVAGAFSLGYLLQLTHTAPPHTFTVRLSQLCHYQSVCSWVSSLTSLSLFPHLQKWGTW